MKEEIIFFKENEGAQNELLLKASVNSKNKTTKTCMLKFKTICIYLYRSQDVCSVQLC